MLQEAFGVEEPGEDTVVVEAAVPSQRTRGGSKRTRSPEKVGADDEDVAQMFARVMDPLKHLRCSKAFVFLDIQPRGQQADELRKLRAGRLRAVGVWWRHVRQMKATFSINVALRPSCFLIA